MEAYLVARKRRERLTLLAAPSSALWRDGFHGDPPHREIGIRMALGAQQGSVVWMAKRLRSLESDWPSDCAGAYAITRLIKQWNSQG